MNFGTPGSSVHGIFQARIPVVVQSLSCDSLWPNKLQHTRLPCPSLSPGDCSNSCPFSQWCYLTTSSSVSPFSSCPQSFPESGSFPELAHHIRWPKYWCFSFSSSPSNEYSGLISFRIDCFPGGSDCREYWSGIAISSSRGSSWPRDWTQVSCVFCIGR